MCPIAVLRWRHDGRGPAPCHGSPGELFKGLAFPANGVIMGGLDCKRFARLELGHHHASGCSRGSCTELTAHDLPCQPTCERSTASSTLGLRVRVFRALCHCRHMDGLPPLPRHRACSISAHAHDDMDWPLSFHGVADHLLHVTGLIKSRSVGLALPRIGCK